MIRFPAMVHRVPWMTPQDLPSSADGQASSSHPAAKDLRRVGYIDKARGLAIALMIADHLCVVFDVLPIYRLTLGRVAMPLFMLLSGFLFRRLTLRHGLIVWVGVVLPLVVPWIDAPNILVLWGFGCVLLALTVRFGRWWIWLPAIALTAGANGWSFRGGPLAYDAVAVWGLMALGSGLTFASWRHFERLPSWLAIAGRFPITLYVGHLLLLQVAVSAFRLPVGGGG